MFYDLFYGIEENIKGLLWNMCVKIVLGVVWVFEYLYEVCFLFVVYCNFKVVNILLDDEFNLYVLDCGLVVFVLFGVEW